MTKGLGFHPFSDGLPYAPVSKSPQISSKRQSDSTPTIVQPSLPKSIPQAPPKPIAPQRLAPSTGSGAVSAGPPKFAFPQSSPMPPARPVLPARPQAAPPAHAPTKATISAPVDSARPGLLYLAKRGAAFFLDTSINLALCGTAFGAVLWKLGIPVDRLLTPEIVAGSALFFVTFNWALITAQEIAFKTSLGKRSFSLTLEGTRTAAVFLRAFFFVFSAGFFGLGLLWALWDSRRRCWHDLFADAAPHEIAHL